MLILSHLNRYNGSRLGAALGLAVLTVPFVGLGAAHADEAAPGGDREVLRDPHLRWNLASKAEVARHLDRDAQGSTHPKASQGRAESVDFTFGDEVYSVDPATEFQAYSAVDEDGAVVWSVGVVTSSKPELATSGFAVPPDSAWRYHNDDSGSVEQGTWKRQFWWTVNRANNYTANGVTRDYYRIYGRLQASVLTSKVNGNSSGFDQAYIEFDRNSNWTSAATTEFEPQQPTDSIDGKTSQTVSIGFKTGLSVTLGKPPFSVSGSYENTYTGTLSSSVEAWHPIQRSEAGSGGVMWCYYKVDGEGDNVEFNGTRTIAGRNSIHTLSTVSPGTWTIYTGQRDRDHGASSCPDQ